MIYRIVSKFAFCVFFYSKKLQATSLSGLEGAVIECRFVFIRLKAKLKAENELSALASRNAVSRTSCTLLVRLVVLNTLVSGVRRNSTICEVSCILIQSDLQFSMPLFTSSNTFNK